MEKYVHEECNLIAQQHVGAVNGTAATGQVVRIYSSRERPKA